MTPHFHRTLDVPIVRGRDFTEAEGWSRLPVAVINRTMAERLWPDSTLLAAASACPIPTAAANGSR